MLIFQHFDKLGDIALYKMISPPHAILVTIIISISYNFYVARTFKKEYFRVRPEASIHYISIFKRRQMLQKGCCKIIASTGAWNIWNPSQMIEQQDLSSDYYICCTESVNHYCNSMRKNCCVIRHACSIDLVTRKSSLRMQSAVKHALTSLSSLLLSFVPFR